MRNPLVHLTIALFVFLALVLFSVTGVLSPVLDYGREGTFVLSYPAVKVLGGTRNFFNLFFSLGKLQRENEILSRQIEELTLQVSRLEDQSAENLILREALDFYENTKLDLVPAEIITYNPLATEQAVVINRGRKDGAEFGDPVVVAGGIVVGVIEKVYDSTSQMNIISSSEVRINASIEGGMAKGIVIGEHGLGLQLDLVSQNEVISSGDRVTTSGLGGNFPAGLLIGHIDEIRSSESELFQRASIVPATNLKNLDVVFIVR